MEYNLKGILKKLRPHAIIVTLLIWGVIILVNYVRINLHFLDPFNNSVKNYEITDIVSSRFRDKDNIAFEEKIVLINTGKPDRFQLARLIERLNLFNPKAIGIDILLEEEKDPKIDSLLAKSIKNTPNIVLATRLAGYNDSLKLFEKPIGCHSHFAQNAQTGYVNFESKDNWTVRSFQPKVETTGGDELAFSVKIAELTAPETLQNLWQRKKKTERIHYLGDINSFVQFEIDLVLDTTLDLSESIKDKIILVGYLGDDEWSKPVKDRFFTPLNEEYAGRSLPDMYGMVIHVNIIAMILNQEYIYEMPKWFTLILELIFSYLNVLLFIWIYHAFPDPFHGITRGIQIIEFVFVFLLISILFHYFKIRIDFGTGILTLLLTYDFVMIYESLLKNRIKFLQKL